MNKKNLTRAAGLSAAAMLARTTGSPSAADRPPFISERRAATNGGSATVRLLPGVFVGPK